MRPRPLAGLVTAAVLLTGGCSGGFDEDAPADLTVDAVRLTGLYAAPAPALEGALSIEDRVQVGGVRADADGGGFVVTGEQTLTSWAAGSEEPRWEAELDDRICRSSPTTGGRIAVLHDPSGAPDACGTVSVLDAATGERLWQRDLGARDVVVSPGLTLGEETLYVGGQCGEVRRYDAASGRPGPTLAPADRICGNEPAFADGLVAIWEDPETADSPDGTGFIPPYDGAGRLRVIDTTTDEVLWTRTMDRRGTGLEGIVSVDPLVLDLREDSYRTMRRFDDEGRPAGYVGKRLDYSDGFTVQARSGDVVVGAYDRLAGTFAYDLTSGEELWRADGGRTAAGVDDDGRLLWTHALEVAREDGGWTSQTQVERTDLRDPDDGEVLGSLDLDEDRVSYPVSPGVGAVVGDDLVVGRVDLLDVVPLPAEGVGPLAGPTSGQWTRYGWGPDDVRPDEATDFCEAVDPAVLETVGFDTEIPPPASCWWLEEEPPYLRRDLRVVVEAIGPSGEASAARAAEQRLADGDRGSWPEVPGLGDEARATSGTSATGQTSSAAVAVRSGNLVVDVELAVDAQVTDTYPGARGVDVVEQAVLDVAADVLGGLGRPVDESALPGPGDAGAVAAAPDTCAAVGAEGASALVPAGTPARDLSPEDDRLSRCSWTADVGGGEIDLTVTAYAVPGGLLPRADGVVPGAEQRARGLRALGRPYAAGGEGARLRIFDGEDYRSALLTVRRQNLLVTVDVGADGAPVPDDLGAAALPVAQRVLDATPE